MATLIKTNDGLIGWKSGNTINWCESRAEVYSVGFGLFVKNLDPADRVWFENEVEIALQYMFEERNNAAEFGIMGSFMFTLEVA